MSGPLLVEHSIAESVLPLTSPWFFSFPSLIFLQLHMMYLGMIYLQLSCSVINVFILSLWGKIPSQHFSTVVLLIFTLLLLQTTIRPLLGPAGNALSIPWVLNTLCYLSLLCWVNSWYYLSICYFSFCVQYRGIYIFFYLTEYIFQF